MHITPTESLSSYSSVGALISLATYGYLSRWGLGSCLPSGQMQVSPGRAPHLGHGLESASLVRSAAGQYRQVALAEIKERPLRPLTKCVTVSFFMPSSWSICISPGVNVTSAPCEVLSCPASLKVAGGRIGPLAQHFMLFCQPAFTGYRLQDLQEAHRLEHIALPIGVLKPPRTHLFGQIENKPGKPLEQLAA